MSTWSRGARANGIQALEFDIARALTLKFSSSPMCEIPPQALFPKVLPLVHRFVHTKVEAKQGYDILDLSLQPYFGWAVLALADALQPDDAAGEVAELPEIERGPREWGSTADVDLWTSREVRDVAHSHLNAAVMDTRVWEENAAYYLDTNAAVISFAKNAGLGFFIPYQVKGEDHEYTPDFLARLQHNGAEIGTLILETKGYPDPLKEAKAAAAKRWVDAVTRDGRYGKWWYVMVTDPTKTPPAIQEAAEALNQVATM